MSRKISRIIIGTEEVISLIILLLVITTITIIIAAMPCTIFAVLTGFISLLTAIKCSVVVGSLLACAILTVLIDHYRHCDSGCRRAD